MIYTDVALDPYSSDGHDGIVREDGKIDVCDILDIAIIFKRKLLIFLKNVFWELKRDQFKQAKNQWLF